jgi:hypothetical protein
MATVTALLVLVPPEHKHSKAPSDSELKLEHVSTALEIAVLV